MTMRLGCLLIFVLCALLTAQEWQEKPLSQAIFVGAYPENVQNDAAYHWEIAEDGAQEMQVYFDYIDVEEGCDFVDLAGSVKGKSGQSFNDGRTVIT
jgi:hypothetical protein